MTILTQALAQKLVDEQGLDVVIPDIYTSIADIAFFRVGITSVRIPNSVSSIGIGAFAENQLTSIDIPNSVESVGRAAFEYNKITNASINNGIKSIGDSAFCGKFLKEYLDYPVRSAAAALERQCGTQIPVQPWPAARSSSRKVSPCLSSSGSTAPRSNVRLSWRRRAGPMGSPVLAAMAMSTAWSMAAGSSAISVATAVIRRRSRQARSCRPPICH